MRRIGIWVAAAVVSLGIVAYAFRAPLLERIVLAGAKRNLSSDGLAALPDGLHIVLCGAGGPLPDPVRSGPCNAVVAGGKLFVVDAGSGAARNLARMDLFPGRVEALLLTHFHSDHIDGMGELAMLRWTAGANTSPLPVLGPPGVEEVVEGFDWAYQQDAVYRTAHHGAATAPPSGAGMEARPFPLPAPSAPIVLHDEDGLRITAFRVDHDPVDPAVGYRFDYGGRSLVISGDTSKSEEIARQATGVDLLVHEALAPHLVAIMNRAARETGRANLEKITRDIPDYHSSPVEAAEIAENAGVKHLLLTHIVPPLPLPGLESVFLRGVDAVYSGPVTLGRDGTTVSLPRDSDAIEVSSR